MKQEFFNVVQLSREDFEKVGFNADNLTDEQMVQIAERMGNVLVENYFWDMLDCCGKELKLPKLYESPKQINYLIK